MKEIEVQKNNRVYATKDKSYGTVKKVKLNAKKSPPKISKANEARYNKILDKWLSDLTPKQLEDYKQFGFCFYDQYVKCGGIPEHCIVDNENKMSIEKLDKEFYINTAKSKIDDYLTTKLTKQEEKKLKEIPKMKTKEEVTQATQAKETLNVNVPVNEVEQLKSPDTSESQAQHNRIALLTKIHKVTRFFNDNAEELEKTKRNDAFKYNYTPTSAYKKVFRGALLQYGLVFKIDTVSMSTVPSNSSTMTTLQFKFALSIIDIDTGDFLIYNDIALGSDLGDKHKSKAETMLIKDFIKANFLISDDDDTIEPESDYAYKQDAKLKARIEAKKAKAAADEPEEDIKIVTVNPNKKGYTSDKEKMNILDNIRKSSGKKVAPKVELAVEGETEEVKKADAPKKRKRVKKPAPKPVVEETEEVEVEPSEEVVEAVAVNDAKIKSCKVLQKMIITLRELSGKARSYERLDRDLRNRDESGNPTISDKSLAKMFDVIQGKIDELKAVETEEVEEYEEEE